jgi:hypothetical protein
MVLDAIDLVLEKVSKAEKDGADHLSVKVGGKNGEASFGSMYDFELFELLPVLDSLDPAKAQILRRDHDAAAALNKKYPKGSASLDAGGATSMMFSSGDSSSAPPDTGLFAQLREADTIVSSAAKNLEAAVASAQSLNNTPTWEYALMTPRCKALDSIATEAAGRKDYAGANIAIKALVGNVQDLPPFLQAHYFARAAGLSGAMGDSQMAEQYIAKGMKVADAVYQKDAFADPPNDAPKAVWPSTAVWKTFVIISARLDSSTFLQQSASIPDPEIEAIANVAAAAILLGQEPGITMIEVSHNRESVMSMGFETPWWSVPKGDEAKSRNQH